MNMRSIEVPYSGYRDLIKIFKHLASVGGYYSDANGCTVTLHVPEAEFTATLEFLA